MATRAKGAAAGLSSKALRLSSLSDHLLPKPSTSASPSPLLRPPCRHFGSGSLHRILFEVPPLFPPIRGFSKASAWLSPFSPLHGTSHSFPSGAVPRKLAVGGLRWYKDGRPRGPLWRGKKMIGKEALLVVLGLKMYKNDKEKLAAFVKANVHRLLKMDKIAVLNELERQEEVELALMMFKIIQKDDWYKPDIYVYKDLIIALSKSKKMEEAMEIWEDMKKANLFPDGQTYTEVIRGFLRYGSPSDAMNIYEDMKKSPEPPEEMPFRILLKGLLPHPLLRNRVKQDFEELFPERHIYDPPEEIFGLR